MVTFSWSSALDDISQIGVGFKWNSCKVGASCAGIGHVGQNNECLQQSSKVKSESTEISQTKEHISRRSLTTLVGQVAKHKSQSGRREPGTSREMAAAEAASSR